MADRANGVARAAVVVLGLLAVGLSGGWSSGGGSGGPPTGRAEIDVLFSPKGGCTDRIVEEIGKAKKRVLVQMHFFTSKPIAKALSEARKRGVECEVIADKSQEKMTYGRLPVLRRDGVNVLIDDQHATANNKIILIDKSTIITGSFNFTKAAEEENAENVLIIQGDKELFAKFLANYEAHKSHSRKFKS